MVEAHNFPSSEPEDDGSSKTFDEGRFVEAIVVGFLSAVSLMLGSMVGLRWPPSHETTGILAAFGAGALIAALTVELMAPIAEEVTSIHTPADEVYEAKLNLVVTLCGSVFGGLLFVVLDQLVNRHGGFISSYYTAVSYYAKRKHHNERILSSLQRSPIFTDVPVEELEYAVLFCRPMILHPGTQIFQRGDVADKLYFIEDGCVEQMRTSTGVGVSVFVGRGGIVGEVGVLNGTYIGTAVASGRVETVWIAKDHLLNLLEECPTFAQAIRSYCVEKLEHIIRSEQTNLDQMSQHTSKQMSGKHLTLPLPTMTTPHPSAQQLDTITLTEAEPLGDASTLHAVTDHMHPRAAGVPTRADLEMQQALMQVEASFRNLTYDASVSTRRRRSVRDLIFASNLMPPGSYAAHGEVVAEAASRALNSPGPQPAHRPAPSLLAWSESGATRPTSPESAAKAGGDTNSTFKDVAAWVAGMGQASTSTMQMGESQMQGPTVAPLAVWLGILLDGIPESIVIGTQYAQASRLKGSDAGLGEMIPYTLIAGLFLSNFPEALSSSVAMHDYGWSKMRVLLMWTSLTVFTSLGAGLGYALAEVWSNTVAVGVQGLAAGAMLTMIASAMIPEALHTAGPTLTGCSVLLGFVAAISFKLLE